MSVASGCLASSSFRLSPAAREVCYYTTTPTMSQYGEKEDVQDDSLIVLRSGDGVLIETKRESLSKLSEIFAVEAIHTHGEIVDLPETSSTLSMLLQLPYSLSYLSINKLIDLSEAAEKYCVEPAILKCLEAMRSDFHQTFLLYSLTITKITQRSDS